MSQDLQAWFRAWVTVPPIIGGLPMLPYSISHAMWLDALNSPLLATGSPVTHGEIWEALGVCSRDHAGNVRVYSFARPDKAALKAARRHAGRPLDGLESSIRGYIDSYTVAPPMVPPRAKQRGYAAPAYNHLIRVLCSVYGVGIDEAMNFPVGLARCLYETDQEAQGGKALAHPVDVLQEQIRQDINAAKEVDDQERVNSLRATLHKLMEAYPREASR